MPSGPAKAVLAAPGTLAHPADLRCPAPGRTVPGGRGLTSLNQSPPTPASEDHATEILSEKSHKYHCSQKYLYIDLEVYFSLMVQNQASDKGDK